jgi:hypothetical protein
MSDHDTSFGYPPGFEIGYDQITAPVSVVSTTEATGTTIITCAAHVFDGGAVICEFFAPAIELPSAISTNDIVVVSLFEGSTQIGRFTVCLLGDLTTGQGCRMPGTGKFRFTPTAGSHTYTVTAFCNSTTGSPSVDAGAASGAGTLMPAFCRFTKV